MRVQRGRDAADAVRDECDRQRRPSAYAIALAAQHRLHDDRGEETECREAGGNQQREWSLDADFWKLVGGQGAEIPDQAENRSREEERIEANADLRNAVLMWNGQVTERAIAQEAGLPYTGISHALAS